MEADFENYYLVLDISIESDEATIKSAYRTQSRKYHPDKNKEPGAKEKFQQIQTAYSVLTDEKAKAAFDAVLKSKAAKRKRDQSMDETRRKMKEDLERRENAFKRQKTEEEEAKQKLKQELERLRKEGFKMREQVKREKETKKTMEKTGEESNMKKATVKAKWDSAKGNYTKERLTEIFQMFGEVDLVVVKKSAALVVYKEQSSAALAVKQTLGNPSNRLELSWAHDDGPSQPKSPSVPSVPTTPSPFVTAEQHQSFEDQILAKLRNASQKNVS